MIAHCRPLGRLLERLRAGLAGVAGRLRRDERGAIAVQFAFLALPITILAFGLLDMNRISVQRRQLQDALDAATLIAARSTATTDAALDTTGDAAFLAEMTGLGVTLTAANSTFKAGTGNRVIGTVSVSIKPIISNLWSKTDPVVTATSEVVRSVNKLEVALVLDNTGSMGSNLGSRRHQDRRPDRRLQGPGRHPVRRRRARLRDRRGQDRRRAVLDDRQCRLDLFVGDELDHRNPAVGLSRR
jgi:Flp pilus assembly protein TadG